MHSAYLYLRDILAPGVGRDEAGAQARLVLEEAFHFSAGQLYGTMERLLSTEEQERLEQIGGQLTVGVPVQYVLGRASFRGLSLRVRPGVLIPRPETEDLVEWVVEDHAGADPFPRRVADMGTGSGAVAIALKKALPHWQVEAWDLSSVALDVARENAEEQGVEVHFRRCDILSAPVVEADVVVANPPYVLESERQEMDPRVRDHEPAEALFVTDAEALVFYRALSRLTWGKRGYFEVNAALALQTAALFHEAGYRHVDLRLDRYGRARLLRVD